MRRIIPRATIWSTMKITCCIVAAGQGTRLGTEWKKVPKAMVPVLGRPMLYYSLNAFDQYNGLSEQNAIDRFVVTAPPDSIAEFSRTVKIWGFSRPVEVIPGGETRAGSVFNALRKLNDNPPDRVLISDSARICLTPEMIDLLVKASEESGEAATLAHRATDTLRNTDNSVITEELDRSNVACIETPQFFPYAEILELHEKTVGSGDVPDDTTLFTRAGKKVHVVYHEGSNMKVTYPEDIAAVEGILFSRGWQDAGEEE